MRNFIRENIRTIIFVIVVLLAIGGIFLYRYIKQNQGIYEPSHENVPKEIIKYDANEYVVYNIDKAEVFKQYYKDYMMLLINNPSKAYNKLTDETKEHVFNNSYDKFIDYVNKLDKTLLMNSKVDRYAEDNNKFIIVDTTEASYVFYDKGVWNYEVDLSVRR